MNRSIKLKKLVEYLGTRQDSAETLIERRGGSSGGLISFEQAEALIRQVARVATDPASKLKAEELSALDRPSLREKLIEIGAIDVSAPSQAPQAPQSPPVQTSDPVIRSSEHFGMLFLKNSTVQMGFVIVALSVQAYMFALLTKRVFAEMAIEISGIHFYAVIFFGVVFEFVGMFIGANFNNRKVSIGGDEISLRGVWLAIFFVTQVITDLCVTNVITNKTIAHIIVAIAMPLAIMAYANLFMQENKTK